MNKVLLLGRLGADPVTKSINSSVVTEFPLATSMKVKKANGVVEEITTWHSVKCWGQMGVTVQKYFRKGDRILITGRIDNRTYTDSEGKTRYVTNIICQEFKFIDYAKKDSGQQPNQNNNSYSPEPLVEDAEIIEDDLPF